MKTSKRLIPFVAAGLLSAFLQGCGEFGQVDQGQVVEYDAQAGAVTLIRDSNYQNPGRPRFDVLPPVKVRVPVNPKEMGPEPEAGRLLDIDIQQRKIVFYDASAGQLRTLEYTPVEVHERVSSNDPRVSGRAFPIVDREKSTVTLYSRRQRLLVTVRIAPEHLAQPHEVWKAGDEVRYYYKEPGQALRMMNVTKTDLTSRG
ncbi:MAG: DUF4881 domain-containing protein [Bryobacteraceae bacterium]|nr:DUF4881 domain-containing protein [Bryobacteraceae bacterium]